MAFLPDTSYESAIGYMKGEQPNLQISGGGTSGGITSTAPSAVTTQQQRSLSPIAIMPTGSTQNILSPLQTGIGTQTGDIQKAFETFQTEAGPSRTYEDIGAQATLQKAIQTPTTQQDYNALLGQAMNVLSSKYTGPTELGQEQVSTLTGTGRELEEKAKALQTGAGIETLLGQAVPSMTPGARKYEAQQVSLSPEYRAYKEQSLTDINKMWQDLAKVQEQATAKAAARTTEEEAIATKGKEYLTGERSQLVEDWNKKIAAAEAQEKATQGAFTNLQEQGTQQALQQIAPEMKQGEWTAEQFNTEARQQLANAQNVFNQVNSMYSDVADLPVLTLTSDKRGNQIYVRPEGVSDEQYQQLLQRQQALEAAGFSPETASTQYGQLATMMPLYYGEGPVASQWVPEDIRQYIELIPGGSPTRENMGTADQKIVYNNIQTLLDEVDRIDSEGEPFKAAKIAANLEQFLTDEEQALTERKETLTKAGEEWKQHLSDVKKAYRRAKKNSAWGKIVRLITAVGSLGATELTRQIPGSAGKAATQALTYGTLAGTGMAATYPASLLMTPEVAYGILKESGAPLSAMGAGIKKAASNE